MNCTIPVIPAKVGDAADIAEIYAHYVQESTATFETKPPSALEMAERMQKILDGGYPWLVARALDGRVVGYAYASRFHPREGYRYAVETSIYLRDDSKGQGVGTKLLCALIEACEKRGFRQAFAFIAGTEPVSVVLHARAGFLPCGTLTSAGRKHSKWIDVFLMQRKLGEGDQTAPPYEP